MNTTSASPAEPLDAPTSAPPPRKVLVWDAPVRVFHWLMVLSFAGAWLTAESERWRLAHVTLGYTMAGLVAFRLVWGLVGTRHARFVNFVRGPAAVLRYLRGLAAGQPEHHAGHNPAGALAIVALLGLAGVVAAAGWATYNGVGGEWLKELHESMASIMLAVVAIHLAGVFVGSKAHGENLPRTMVTGRKLGPLSDAIVGTRPLVAIGLVGWTVLVAWWLSR